MLLFRQTLELTGLYLTELISLINITPHTSRLQQNEVKVICVEILRSSLFVTLIVPAVQNSLHETITNL